ncbi:MAG: hypothetical protein AB1646_00410 [Thermodesulfobacteriota bacterium]
MKKILTTIVGILVLASAGVWNVEAGDLNAVVTVRPDAARAVPARDTLPSQDASSVRDLSDRGPQIIKIYSAEERGDTQTGRAVPGEVALLFVQSSVYLVRGPAASISDLRIKRVLEELARAEKAGSRVVSVAQPGGYVQPAVVRQIADVPQSNPAHRVSVPLPVDANIRGGLRHLGYNY